jgi:RNA polymerase sigma-70 factor (ECF subfamily)
MTHDHDRLAAEERFRAVFSLLGAVTAYARRRGSKDPDAVAAEVMTVAWRRLADVPLDDARPWLYATARNLVLAEARRSAQPASRIREREQVSPAPELSDLDPALAQGLRSLSRLDQEALLLVAWEDLRPREAARALGISSAAFRVRLLRARRRLRASLEASQEHRPAPLPQLDAEGT